MKTDSSRGIRSGALEIEEKGRSVQLYAGDTDGERFFIRLRRFYVIQPHPIDFFPAYFLSL